MSLISEEPSEGLMRELRVLANSVKPARRPWWQPSLAIAGTAAVTFGIVVLTMAPSKARAYDSILAATNRQSTFLLSVDSNDEGTDKHVNIVGVDGTFTIRGEEGSLVQFGKGALSVYDPKENTVTRIKLSGIVDPQTIGKMVQSGISEGLKQMDLKKTLREYEQKYGKDHIKISGVTHEDGKDVYHVTMDSPQESSRVQMLVDANTDLPQRIDVEDKDSDSGTKHNSTIRMQFGAQVDPKLVAPDFPKNAKVVDIDLGNLIGGAMKGVGGAMTGMGEALKNLGPMIQQGMKEGMKDGKDPHFNFNFGSSQDGDKN